MLMEISVKGIWLTNTEWSWRNRKQIIEDYYSLAFEVSGPVWRFPRLKHQGCEQQNKWKAAVTNQRKEVQITPKLHK